MHQFSTESTVYYKNATMRGNNNEVVYLSVNRRHKLLLTNIKAWPWPSFYLPIELDEHLGDIHGLIVGKFLNMHESQRRISDMATR